MATSQGSPEWPGVVRAVAERCTRELSGDECYQRLSSLGLQYGPEFRGLSRLWVGTREAVGELHCPSGKSGPFSVPPGLLDSGLQALAVLASLEQGADGAPLLPAVIGRVRVRGSLKDRAACRAVLQPGGDAATWTGQVELYDAGGELAVEVQGLVLRPSGDALSSRGWARERAYSVEWEPAASSPARSAPSGPWLWIAGDEAAARAVAAELASQGRSGDAVVAWPRGGAPRPISFAASDAPDPSAGWEALLDRAGAERAVWLAPELQPEDVAAGCERGLALCQAAVRSRASRLLLATYGAWDPAAPDPSQASLWGMLRTFAREHPDRWGGLLDLPAGSRQDARSAVSFALQAADAERAVRGGALHQPRLARPALPSSDAPALRPEASYLVTGGLGGVGMALAQWLVDRGAAHLLLMGRSAPSAEAESAMAELERRGARVHVIQGDISRAEDVAAALARPAALGWPELKGVFHLAAALADGVTQSLDAARLGVALAPKATGAWHLHRATASLRLDLFVLFSSIASFGTPGQAGYAAANAFLDSLAARRRAEGLPALSLGLGAVAGVGAAARLEASGGRGAPGVEPMPHQRVLDAMGVMLSFQGPHALVASMSWPAFAQGLPPGASALYSGLLGQDQSPAAAASAVEAFAAMARRLPPPARREALQVHLREQVAQLLGLTLEQAPGLEQPLMQAGVDSLMTVQLRNGLRASLELDLPVTLLFDYPTIAVLAEHLSTILGEGEISTAAPVTPAALEKAPASPEDLETLLSELERLPEEEVARRLREGASKT